MLSGSMWLKNTVFFLYRISVLLLILTQIDLKINLKYSQLILKVHVLKLALGNAVCPQVSENVLISREDGENQSKRISHYLQMNPLKTSEPWVQSIHLHINAADFHILLLLLCLAALTSQ